MKESFQTLICTLILIHFSLELKNFTVGINQNFMVLSPPIPVLLFTTNPSNDREPPLRLETVYSTSMTVL